MEDERPAVGDLDLDELAHGGPVVGLVAGRRFPLRRGVALAVAVVVVSGLCSIPYRRTLDSRATGQVLKFAGFTAVYEESVARAEAIAPDAVVAGGPIEGDPITAILFKMIQALTFFFVLAVMFMNPEAKKGIIDPKDVVFFLSLMGFTLFLNVVALER